jgi:hypothetical protein
VLRRWSFPRSRAEALFECLQQTARIASLKAVNGSSLLACTASPDQRLHSFPICVDVADRLERHGPLFNEAEGQSEFLRADYRRAGAVLTLAPDLRLIEQGMCDGTVPGGLRTTTDSRLCIVICATPNKPLRQSASYSRA